MINIIREGVKNPHTFECRSCGCKFTIDYNNTTDMKNVVKHDEGRLYMTCPNCGKAICNISKDIV